jgi:hypothetical protein
MIMTIIFRELYNLNDLKHNHAFVSTYTSVLIIRVVFFPFEPLPIYFHHKTG